MASAASFESESEATRADTIERLLKGAVDLHCHSGPSVMPRDLDHIEAIEQASAAGFKAILFKDHYYSVTPVVQLLAQRYAKSGVSLLSGIALNNAVGGLNRYAVDHTLKLGGRIVWMPTFSAANHIDCHRTDAKFHEKFPSPKEAMLAPTPLRVIDQRGKLLDEVCVILDLIADHDAVLSAGHLHISEIWPLFEAAKQRGVRRLLVNHPNYVIGATLADIRSLAAMGAYLEHSVCMYVEGSRFKFYDPATLRSLVEAGTVERTILGSDLGQSGNPLPVDGFRAVIRLCLEIGFSEEAIRKMVGLNAASLMDLTK